MQRKFFDVFASAIGLVMVVALLVAGSLLMWGYSFANSNVHNQLAAQDITFPTAAEFAHAKPGTEITPQMLPYLLQYAGQPLTTGAQAEAYANHFIAYHLAEMPYNGVYATVSAALPGQPDQRHSWPPRSTRSSPAPPCGDFCSRPTPSACIATIAFWAGIAAFVLAGVMLILVAFGFWHARRTVRTRSSSVHNDHLVVKSEEPDGNGNGHVKDPEPVSV